MGDLGMRQVIPCREGSLLSLAVLWSSSPAGQEAALVFTQIPEGRSSSEGWL